MIPGAGFYGLLDAMGRLRVEDCSMRPLPSPQRTGDGLWYATWATTCKEASDCAQGRRGIAFLGELYNLDELRRQLDAPPDLSPAQVLLRAHERWQADFVRRLDGLYALALWDGERLSLCRDGSGARNLYYSALPGGGIAFATHLHTLLRLPGVEKRLAQRSLHEFLRFLDITPPNTLFEGVYALEPGHRLTRTAGELRLDDPHAGDHDESPPQDYDAALNRLEDLLQRSIERRIAGLDRPAAFLSGGVDSSLICAVAARIRPDITAVTVGFDGARYDETPVARQVAAHLGIEHQILRFGVQDYRSAFEAFNRGAEQPVADPAAPPTLLAFEQCHDRFDTVLDGSGADEIAGTMPPRHVRIAVEYAARLPARLRRQVADALRRLPGLAGYAPIFDFEHPAELSIRWRGFTRAEIEMLCGEAVSFEHTHFYRTFARFTRSAHFERGSALLDILPGDRLHQAAAMSGLSLRFPYWDMALGAFVRTLPQDYRCLPSRPKRILRDLLARHVPSALWDGPKHGFDFPLSEFLGAEDFQLVRRYLHEGHWARWQLLEPDSVGRYARQFMAGDQQLTFRVWALVVLSAWLEAHLGKDQDAHA